MGKTLSLYEPLTLSLVPVLMNLSPDSIPEDEINLLDLLIIIARNKKMILSVTFVGAVLSVGISLLLPKIYTATFCHARTIGWPVCSRRCSRSCTEIERPNALYLAMLKSRTIGNKIVSCFDLQMVHEAKAITEPSVYL